MNGRKKHCFFHLIFRFFFALLQEIRPLLLFLYLDEETREHFGSGANKK